MTASIQSRLGPGHATLRDLEIVSGDSLDEMHPEHAGGPTRGPATRAERREAVRAADDARIASLMSTLSDPDAFLMIAQSMLRDTQTRGRQSDTETRQAAARASEALRSQEIEAALHDATQARDAELVGNVLKGIGAALAAVVGVLGAVFTGGASVVAAVGLIIAIVGPLVCDALAQAEVLPNDIALGVGIGCAVVGSALSFGAGAVGGAAQAGSQAVQIAAHVTRTSLQLTQATVATVQSGYSALAAVERGDSMHHGAEAVGAEARRDLANESADAAVESVATLLRLFGRLGERMREIREARARTMDVLTQDPVRA